jgi:glycogen(starch) synthase
VIIVAHSCVLSWWESVEGGPLPERLAPYKDAVKRGLRAAHAVIAVSQSMRASLECHYGPLPRAAVIPNGLALESRSPVEKEPFVLAAGRVSDRAKNVELLARVAPRLPWPVKVAGAEEGDGVALDGVESLGWLPAEELAAVMERASIFALPARYEPFGLSVLEAALRGCALVLGDIPSLREVWGDAAIYVRPDDEAGLEEAISRLVGDPALRAEHAASANLRARLYTAARNARAMRDLYETMILARRVPVLMSVPGPESRSA